MFFELPRDQCELTRLRLKINGFNECSYLAAIVVEGCYEKYVFKCRTSSEDA